MKALFKVGDTVYAEVLGRWALYRIGSVTASDRIFPYCSTSNYWLQTSHTYLATKLAQLLLGGEVR